MSTQSFVEIPETSHYWLVNGRVPTSLLAQPLPPDPAAAAQGEAWVGVDIEICDGRVVAIAPVHSAPAAAPRCDLDQGLVWPCFVDMHTHLDKAHTWPRIPEPQGTFAAAIAQVDEDRLRHWRYEELRARMDFALACSYAHGTRALRTHLDCLDGQEQVSFAVVEELRRRWGSRVELQHVALVPMDFFLSEAAAPLADRVAESSGILGGVTYGNPQLPEQIDRAFQLAKERQLALDLHVDESLNPADQALALVAAAKLRHDFELPVTCAHVCSLSVQPEETVAATLAQVKAAAISLVSLPLCNLYLQDRTPGYTPRYRGVTLLREIQQRGISIALASDNCRDPFFAYGDHDGLEVFTQSVRIGQLDCPYGPWPQAVTRTPATLMGLAQPGTVGTEQPADLVLFKARTLNELVARSQADRVVLRQGQPIDTQPPDYRQLDPWIQG